MENVSRKGFLKSLGSTLVALGICMRVEAKRKWVPPSTESFLGDGTIKFHEQPFPPMIEGKVRFVRYYEMDWGRWVVRADLLTDLTSPDGDIFTALWRLEPGESPDIINSHADAMASHIIKEAKKAGYECK